MWSHPSWSHLASQRWASCMPLTRGRASAAWITLDIDVPMGNCGKAISHYHCIMHSGVTAITGLTSASCWLARVTKRQPWVRHTLGRQAPARGRGRAACMNNWRAVHRGHAKMRRNDRIRMRIKARVNRLCLLDKQLRSDQTAVLLQSQQGEING